MSDCRDRQLHPGVEVDGVDNTLGQILTYLYELGRERDLLLVENKALRARLPVEEISETELEAAVAAMRANGT